ncbi:unnamed protein product [Closterium sp. NIES-65]|nr:unnamed protein product [Closterium sp. NIES-65]
MPQISPELAEAAKRLHESSTKVYNLADDTTRSPSPLSFPPDVPPAPHLEGCTANTGLYFILTPSHSSPPLPTPPHPSASLPTPSHLSTVLDQAPHLEDCTAKTALRVKAEARGAHGEDPAWVLQLHAPTPLDECFGAAVLLLEDRAQCTVQAAREDPEWVLLCYLASAATAHEFRVDSKLDVSHTAGGSSPVHSASSKDPRVGAVLLGKASAATAQRTPQPPRIRGSDAANLALTRVFQRDLWERQFPASCAGRRLMITDWPPKHHGTGNMVHVMGSFLNAAVRHNRTLVIRPRTFHRASGQECAGVFPQALTPHQAPQHQQHGACDGVVSERRRAAQQDARHPPPHLSPRWRAGVRRCVPPSTHPPSSTTAPATVHVMGSFLNAAVRHNRTLVIRPRTFHRASGQDTGNMVHVMGSFLNAAVRHNRTLVIRPRTFHRASGQECAGVFPQALTPHQAPQHQQHGACDGVVSERRRAAQQDARHPPPHLSPRWRAGVRRCVPPSTHPPSSTTAPATVHVMGSFLNAAVRHNRTLVIRPRTFHRASGQDTGNMVHVMGSFLNAAVRHNRTLVIRPRTFHRASGQDTGNMVHVMGSFLNAAVRHNRTLVIRPRTFHRASGQECAGVFPQALTPHQAPQHQQHGACDGVVSERRRAAQQDARHPPPHLSPRWRAGVRRCVPPSTHPPSSTTAPATVHVMGSFLNAAVRHNRTLVIRPRTFHRASGQDTGNMVHVMGSFLNAAVRHNRTLVIRPRTFHSASGQDTGNMVHVMGSFLNAAVRHNRTLVIRPRTFHSASGQDTGNMVHVMGSFLNAAVRHNRTLVIRPRTFHSASGQECAGRSLSAPAPSTVLAGRSAQVCSPKHSYPTHHGTGNMVHVMGSFLNAAVRHNRTLVIRPRTFHRSSRQAGVCRVGRYLDSASGGECGVDGYRTGGEYKEGNSCAVLCSAKGRSSSALAPSTALVGGNVGWMGTGQAGGRVGVLLLPCRLPRLPQGRLSSPHSSNTHRSLPLPHSLLSPVSSPPYPPIPINTHLLPDIGQEGEWECYFFPVAPPDCLKEGEWECYFFPVAYPDCLKVAPSLLSCLSYCPPMCPPYPHPPDIGQEGEWECYFFPVASPDCLKVALAAEATAPIALFNDTKETVLASATQVVICNDTHYHHDAARAASLWVAPDGRPPELEHPFTIEQLGRIWVPNDNHIGERWWRSQTARFLLRWPSALLCHITNRVRHNTYGMAVAERVVSATAKQQTILHSTPPNTPESQHLNSLPDASSAVPPSVAYKSSLAGTVWQMKGFAGCVGTRCNESEACAGAGSANAGGGAALEFSSLQDELFIFRPYVSLHVRLSDKYLEMKLHFFATYMYFMYKLRAHVPNLEHVWLSTEMQSVIEETSNFPDWTFHYTTSGRVTSATQMQEEHVKDKQRTGEIFANLIITTQADYFVGALASNWNRLIDELRSTNGRLYSGHVALNEAWT